MQEEPHLQLTFEAIGDIDSMLVKPNAISSPSIQPRYQYYLFDKLLNQITKEQLAIMISTLKVNKHWIQCKGINSRWNIYQDLLIIVLLKLNQFHLCTKVRDSIFATIAKLVDRTKLSISGRNQKIVNLQFNQIWLALQKEHDLLPYKNEKEKNRIVDRYNPRQYSLVFDVKLNRYHATRLNAKRWKVLGVKSMKSTLSLEEMGKLDKVCELIFEKNFLKDFSFPKNRWEMLFDLDKVTKNKISDVSSEDDKDSCDEQSDPPSAEQRNKAKTEKLLPFTMDSVGDIFEMEIGQYQKRRKTPASEIVQKIRPIIDQITGEQLQKMLLFLKDEVNRAHFVKIQSQATIQKNLNFHTFEDILILSLLKVNQHQLDCCNCFIILKKCQYFLRRHEVSLQRRINFFNEASFQKIWEFLFSGYLLSRYFLRKQCAGKCCQGLRQNNMCSQDSKKQKLPLKQIQRISLVISRNQKPQSLSPSMEFVPMKPCLLNNEKPRTISPGALENNDGKEENHGKGRSELEEKEEGKKQFDFVQNSSTKSLESGDDSEDLDGFEIEREDEAQVTKGSITRAIKEKLSSFAKQALANPEAVEKCFVFRRLDRQEVFQIRLKEILFECMRLVRRRKEVSDGAFAAMQNYLSALRQVSRLEDRRKLSRAKEVRRKERIARRRLPCSGLESQSGGGPCKTKRREKSLRKEIEEASALERKFLSMGGLGARLSECAEAMADALT